MAAVAVEQGVAPEELAARAVTESFRPRRRLSFIAMGRFGDSDTSERHKEIISDAFANKTADDV